MTWLNSALAVDSKGLTVKKAKTLAGLHTRRNETKAQFYTPQWVARAIWALLTPHIQKAYREDNYPIAVLDNAIGSGRLVADAPVDWVQLYGCDIDERCIEALSEDATAAGIHYEFAHAGMETIDMHGFGIAITNPPFSLTLRSPLMHPYTCTCYGDFGPNTHALSHEYALEQALDVAGVVVAILPRTMRERCYHEPRLIAEYQLPSDTFIDEGANVSTSVFVFDRVPADKPPLTVKVTQSDDWPALPALSVTSTLTKQPVFRAGGVDYEAPTIQTPVTQDNRVELHHHNRKLVLKFHCGLTEAKVLNGLLETNVPPADKHRYPKEIRFIGDGKFYLDAYLIQPDPEAAFWETVKMIERYGGQPIVSPTLYNYFLKLIKKHKRASVPYRHVVKTANVPVVRVIVKRSMLIEPGNTQSPALRKGQEVELLVHNGEYELNYNSYRKIYRRDQVQQLFTFADDIIDRDEATWKVVHEGLLPVFPELTKQFRAMMRKKGIDWLWAPQEDALIEQLIRPYGGIAGWQPGTGKARLAIALALCAPSASLVVLESGLVKEMLSELQKIQLDPDCWQVLDERTAISQLKQVNIVSYNKLKKIVAGKQTLAKRLRKQFHTVVADEGGLLSNENTQQSRAVITQLVPRKLYVLDGTPLGNYCNEALKLTQATAGHGVAHQPYARRNGIALTPQLLRSASYCERGIDSFKDKHMVFEWVTHEYLDNLSDGAKREIPKIAGLPIFREWLAPLVQRRLRKEPEFADYTGCPDPIKEKRIVQWDKEHFAHYMKTAREFARWYSDRYQKANEAGKKVNFITVLARINAVIKAANSPHVYSETAMAHYTPLTSKQRYILDEIKDQVAQGRKTIVYVTSPGVVERLHTELAKQGIGSIRFHGERSIQARTQELDDFRYGKVDVLVSTWVGQRGLNIPQAKTVIYGSRNWSADTEAQALERTQRPDQEDAVYVLYVHLQGSIDEYMDQVVDWKEAASDAGLDWGDGATESEVFCHMDTILDRFVKDILKMDHKAIDQLIRAA